MLNADAYEVLQSDRHEGIEGLGHIFTLIFSCCDLNATSVSDLKPEVGCFSQTGSWKDRNRKSKCISSESSSVFVMRVLSSFFDFSILSAARIIFVRVCPYTST